MPAKARDSADRRAHSTDVRRTRHALTHFLLCRTRRGKIEVGAARERRGATSIVDAAAAAAVPLVAAGNSRTFPVASGSGVDVERKGLAVDAAIAGTLTRASPGPRAGSVSGLLAVLLGVVSVLSSAGLTRI